MPHLVFALNVAAIVKMLLAAGADRNVSVNGMRPVDLARREGKGDVVALLLTEGQPSWGSGQPRKLAEGTTGKFEQASQRAQAMQEAKGIRSNAAEQKNDFEMKVFRHRERLLKMKDAA